jgi:hypothetical protein
MVVKAAIGPLSAQVALEAVVLGMTMVVAVVDTLVAAVVVLKATRSTVRVVVVARTTLGTNKMQQLGPKRATDK